MTPAKGTFWRYARLEDFSPDRGDALCATLTDAERQEFDHWRHADRRRGWLAARLLARQLLRAYALPPKAGEAVIEICSRDAAGRSVRPIVKIDGAPTDVKGLDKTGGDCPDFAQSAEQNGAVPFSETVLLGPLSLSLSHTEEAVLVGLCLTPGVRIGVDLVQPVTLDQGFLDTWLTDAERTHLATGDSLESCRLWAAKEAAYKAVNRHDSFAPRQISIRPAAGGQYRCSYRKADLADRCRIAVWQCDDHVAALAFFCEAADLGSTIWPEPGFAVRHLSRVHSTTASEKGTVPFCSADCAKSGQSPAVVE